MLKLTQNIEIDTLPFAFVWISTFCTDARQMLVSTVLVKCASSVQISKRSLKKFKWNLSGGKF